MTETRDPFAPPPKKSKTWYSRRAKLPVWRRTMAELAPIVQAIAASPDASLMQLGVSPEAGEKIYEVERHLQYIWKHRFDYPGHESDRRNNTTNIERYFRFLRHVTSHFTSEETQDALQREIKKEAGLGRAAPIKPELRKIEKLLDEQWEARMRMKPTPLEMARLQAIQVELSESTFNEDEMRELIDLDSRRVGAVREGNDSKANYYEDQQGAIYATSAEKSEKRVEELTQVFLPPWQAKEDAGEMRSRKEERAALLGTSREERTDEQRMAEAAERLRNKIELIDASEVFSHA